MSPQPPPGKKLQKGTLKKLSLGQAFAEYDKLLEKDNVFVETPALRAAMDPNRAKCFFVGRRGTGKTAINLYLERRFPGQVLMLLPQLFTPIGRLFELELMKDVHQQPFKSLVASFKRAILDEVVRFWIQRGIFSYRKNSPETLTRERNFIEDYEFDLRLLTLAEDTLEALNKTQDKEWLRHVSRWKEIAHTMDTLTDAGSQSTIILVDRIDESWDGSDKSVVLLMALMHACVELASVAQCVKPLVFLRENVFERVRLMDKEFSRLETFVTSLEWTKELLVELVERRLNLPLIAKFSLHGETWDAFFESTEHHKSQDVVFEYCHYRPREVLVLCSFAIEAAQSRLQEKVQLQDLLSARRRFSDSRLKDLSDEYADNFPQLQLVLARFYGLGYRFTVQGIADFVKKLLVDEEIKKYCAKWIFKHTQPDLFIKLLYDIGFVGLDGGGQAYFRSSGSQSTTPPPVDVGTIVTVHPTYRDALSLRDSLISSLDPDVPLRESGVLADFPAGMSLDAYYAKLRDLREQLRTLPEGDRDSEEYAGLVGEVITLCFFRSLTNLEPKVRSVDGRVIRDWIASNHSPSGFWELVRLKHGATQVIFECKNYSDLSASDFHQVSYYLNDTIGLFGALVFRGQETKKHHYEHVKRIANDKKALVLLLTDRDIDIFLRQAINGKSSEGHVQELYDGVVREIS
jgi:hypothetical protein